jgi:hypothetical protein
MLLGARDAPLSLEYRIDGLGVLTFFVSPVLADEGASSSSSSDGE